MLQKIILKIPEIVHIGDSRSRQGGKFGEVNIIPGAAGDVLITFDVTGKATENGAPFPARKNETLIRKMIMEELIAQARAAGHENKPVILL